MKQSANFFFFAHILIEEILYNTRSFKCYFTVHTKGTTFSKPIFQKREYIVRIGSGLTDNVFQCVLPQAHTNMYSGSNASSSSSTKKDPSITVPR